MINDHKAESFLPQTYRPSQQTSESNAYGESSNFNAHRKY
jgi:hypothetical protein